MHRLCVTGCRQKHAIHAESQWTDAHTPGEKKKKKEKKNKEIKLFGLVEKIFKVTTTS